MKTVFAAAGTILAVAKTFFEAAIFFGGKNLFCDARWQVKASSAQIFEMGGLLPFALLFLRNMKFAAAALLLGASAAAAGEMAALERNSEARRLLSETSKSPWNVALAGMNETLGFSLDRLAFDTSDGTSRVAYLYIPESAKGKGPVPLVVDFHALASDPFAESELTQFPKKADDEGFVVVFP